MRPVRGIQRSGVRAGLPNRCGNTYSTYEILWFNGRDSAAARALNNYKRGSNYPGKGQAFMALVKKSPVQERKVKRIWKTPGSKMNWLFLALSMTTLGSVYLLYRTAIATQPYPGPYNAPFRQFGIVSFVLVLAVGGHTFRRRFLRSFAGEEPRLVLPHVLFGAISGLISIMHQKFPNINHYNQL